MPGFQNRLRFLTLLVLLFALLLVAKLYFLQIVSGEDFKLKAEHQYVAGINYFDRGSIFFSTKDGTLVPAATVKLGFTISLNPNILKDRSDLEEIYGRLNAIIPLDKEIFLSKAKKVNDPYEELSRRLSDELAERIQNEELPGISVTRERWRSYPGEKMAAHAVGLIGYSGNELAGRYGLERFYDKTLERSGDDVFVNFFAEIFSNIKSAVEEDERLEGDIVTTIEPSVEAFLESEVGKVTTTYSSDFSGAVIINPQTGEIFAMALNPAFDPNFPQNEKDSSVFRNILVEDRYEMGSIIKALTMASGLDSGAVTAKTVYNDPGCITLNTKTFCNYDGQSHGYNLSMQEVLNKSLNTGAAFVASKISTRKFEDYMLRFGLENLTGIDLPNEGKSIVSNLKTHRDLEAAQASFGQGIALTPITTVRVLSVLANGGTLITPHLVKEIRYKLGPTKTISYPREEDGQRVISKESSAEISRMLTEVVDRALRYGQMRLENYSVAAKTGTAQIANPAGGGYYQDRFLHSFFGYFPAYDPQFLVFLYTYYPKNVQFASETLTDAFFDITKFLINYYDIPPDRQAPPPASFSLN
ncbi:MAG: penicillin-binding protein 2 [Patescibacteria group bacterium]